jgi:hypothetical protein
MFCTRCGYDLAGVAAAVCPECARPFDAANPKTFDASRAARVRRRVLKPALIAVAVIGILCAIAPHGVATASLTWSPPSPASGSAVASTVITRSRLIPPKYMRWVRYPFWTTTESVVTNVARAKLPASAANNPVFMIFGKSRRWIGDGSGLLSGYGDIGPGESTIVNGVPLTLASATDMLDAIAFTYIDGGGGGGISFSAQPAPTPAPTSR